LITLKALRNQQLANGRIEWLGVRPQAGAAMILPGTIELRSDQGIVGDRFNSKRNTDRQVTLVQSEHLAVIATLLARDSVQATQLRRNICVSGVNLLALIGRMFVLGSAVLEGTGRCHPCSRMESILGEGGYNAMRGHGGITARVITNGIVTVGDSLQAVAEENSAVSDTK